MDTAARNLFDVETLEEVKGTKISLFLPHLELPETIDDLAEEVKSFLSKMHFKASYFWPFTWHFPRSITYALKEPAAYLAEIDHHAHNGR